MSRYQWDKTRKAVIARDQVCQGRLAFPDIDCWVGLHVHHLRRRSQGGTNDLTNLFALCAAHHDAVDANPSVGVGLGLLDARSTGSKVVPRPELRETA